MSTSKPLKINRDDHIAVRRTLDESVALPASDYGYPEDLYSSNLKLGLMFSSCGFAAIGQFAPVPFPESRPLLAVCCALYFVLSGILTFIMTFVDPDIVATTKQKEDDVGTVDTSSAALRFRSSMARTSHIYKLTVEAIAPGDSTSCTMKHSVGRYFTERGEFHRAAFDADVTTLLQKFEAAKAKKSE